MDVLWKNFGQERLILGSNWPRTKNSGDYTSFVKLVNEYFSARVRRPASVISGKTLLKPTV